jgi:hypothetical protein
MNFAQSTWELTLYFKDWIFPDLLMPESEEGGEKYPNLVGLFERASFYCSNVLPPS